MKLLAFLFLLFPSIALAVITPQPGTIGQKKLIVYLVDYADGGVGNDISIAKNIADQLSEYYKTLSSGLYILSGKQNPTLGGDAVKVRITLTTGTCQPGNVEAQAAAAGISQGYNELDYDFRVFLMPSSPCPWLGINSGGAPDPIAVFAQGEYSLRVIGHEGGHGLYLLHSHSESCNSSYGCNYNEYGDQWDMMGKDSGIFNGYELESIGWINKSGTPILSTVTTPGNYSILPLELFKPGLSAIKIQQNSTSGLYYYVTFHSGTGYTANKPPMILIHRSTNVNGSFDDRNQSYVLGWINAAGDFNLKAGDCLCDIINNVYITFVSQSPTEAVVNVSFVHPVFPDYTYIGAHTNQLTIMKSGTLQYGFNLSFLSKHVNAGDIIYCQDDNFPGILPYNGGIEKACLFKPDNLDIPNPAVNLTVQ